MILPLSSFAFEISNAERIEATPRNTEVSAKTRPGQILSWRIVNQQEAHLFYGAVTSSIAKWWRLYRNETHLRPKPKQAWRGSG